MIVDISLRNMVINILDFMENVNSDIKVILHNITEDKNIWNTDFDQENPIVEKKAWENFIIFLERDKSFSTDIHGKMSGAIVAMKNYQKIGCSVYGLSLTKNVFLSLKIVEIYTKIDFKEIIKTLEEANAPLEKNTLLEMHKNLERYMTKK